MMAERGEPKKVHAVILKRKSIHSNNCLDILDMDDADEDEPAVKRGKGSLALNKKLQKNKATPISIPPIPILPIPIATVSTRANASNKNLKPSDQSTTGSQETKVNVERKDNKDVASIEETVPKVEMVEWVGAVKNTRSMSRRQKSIYAESISIDDEPMQEHTAKVTEITDDTKTDDVKLDDRKDSTDSALKLQRSLRMSKCIKEKEVDLCNSTDEKEASPAKIAKNNTKTGDAASSSQNITTNNAETPHLRQRLRPFIEIKQEKVDAPEAVDSSSLIETVSISSKSGSLDVSIASIASSSGGSSLLLTSKPNEATTTASADEPMCVKIEPDSDDSVQSVSMEDDDWPKKPNDTCNTSPGRSDTADISESVSQLISNIKRGGISVRDINKMTNTSKTNTDIQPPVTLSRILSKPAKNRNSKMLDGQQRARKSFPIPMLKPPLGQAKLQSQMPNGSNKSPRMKTTLSNMVYIPIDSANCFPRMNSSQLNDTLKSIHPPPLAVVGSGSNPITSPVSTALVTNNMTSTPDCSISGVSFVGGPPPLSLTTIPAVNVPALQSQQRVASVVAATMPITNQLLTGMVTENLASAVTDTLIRAPPKMTSRPNAPMRSHGDVSYPSEAGNVSRTLMENAHKMTDFFRSVIEDTLSDLANTTSLEAKCKLLEIEMEKLKYTHSKEVVELKANTDKLLGEMRNSMENERTRIVGETRKQCELERIRSVEETKKKQWCIQCGKEAQFYCCWNTSYCDYPCQQKHWTRHMTSCEQADGNQAANLNVSFFFIVIFDNVGICISS